MKNMQKHFPVILALIAMVISGCSKSSKPIVHESEDTRPAIVLEGTGYQLSLPAYAEDVECTPVSDERFAELRNQGYNLIVRPINVTRNGENHVQLGQPATVRFAIPADFPKEQYNELVGVLITDNGPEYKIPDYYALRDGYVQFETSHFSIAAAGRERDELRERFIEEVAVNGWGRNMSNRQIEPTWREQLNKFADDFCMGENDLVGIAMREVFGDKDIVKIGIDIVNAHDMEDATFEQRAEVATENIKKLAEAKLMSYFLKKLKEEETKKIKVIDEMNSNKKGEIVYKTELKKIDSKRNKIIGVLEDHFSVENVEKLSETLGSEPTAEECYIYACKYLGNFALEKWKEGVIEMVPYLNKVKMMATATEIFKKFWAATQMQDLYKRYEEIADQNGGDLLSPGEWKVISIRVATPESLHGMTDDQIKEMIEQRYLEKKEIEQRKKELRKYLGIIEKYANLETAACFEDKHFDYVQRLTVVNNLIDRFYDELVDKDGELVFMDNGKRQVYSGETSITEQLCLVVNEYLYYYPNRDQFYEWLKANGYNYGQLDDEYARLDKLLWKEKKDPDVHIVIRERVGATSGGPKYLGHTICLAKDGKPYKEWYRTIPNVDSLYDLGWSTEFPEEDMDMKLSEYDAIGRPNQVFVYRSIDNFLNSQKPVDTFFFQVDTMNNYTYVELNDNVVTMREFVYVHRNTWVAYRSRYKDEKTGKTHMVSRWRNDYAREALGNALRDVHLHLMYPADDFTFTVSGEEEDGSGRAQITLTVSGHIDFKHPEKNTCTMSASGTVVESDGREKCTFRYPNLIGTYENMIVQDDSYGDSYFKCSAEGPVEIESVSTWEGKTTVDKDQTLGNICFEFVEAPTENYEEEYEE